MRHAIRGGFQGECYQTAGLSALMLDDDVVVQHGKIDLPATCWHFAQKGYEHAWVDNIMHRGKKYIFDPALSMLALSDEYSEKLNARVAREIPAEKIKRFIVDVHTGCPLKEYGNREEHYGYVRGIITDENSVATPSEYDELPNPYFNVSAGAKEGFLVGPINVHLRMSRTQKINGFDAKIYMGG